MKLPLLIASSAFLLSSLRAAEPPQLVRLWETEATLRVPEGVHFDADRKVLYVSNIDGTEPWAKDGVGSIAKVGLDGTIIEVEWVKGLHAPKGLARVGERLYVADVDQLVVIDVNRGALVERIEVPEAKRLNDVAADAQGNVFVTDSQTGRVHRLEGGKRVTVYSEAFKSPNGVLAGRDGIYVLDQEALHRVDPTGKAERVLGGLAGHVDGVEQDGAGFIVTCWEGRVYFATAEGGTHLVLDTREQKANAADPAYDPVRRILYVPTFWKNTVVAYQLK